MREREPTKASHRPDPFMIAADPSRLTVDRANQMLNQTCHRSVRFTLKSTEPIYIYQLDMSGARIEGRMRLDLMDIVLLIFLRFTWPDDGV